MPKLRRTVLAAVPLLVACGGDPTAVPLLSGTVSAVYEDITFTAVNGFASIESENGTEVGVIALGAGAINCDTPGRSSPPPGNNAVIGLENLDVGVDNDAFVQIFINEGGFRGRGSSGGMVEITASSAESVAGTVDWSFTDGADTYSLSGTFEVSRCP